MRIKGNLFKATALAMIVWLLSSALMPAMALAREIEIPFGTAVPLRVGDSIHPATHIVGQQVVFIVDRDIVIDDEIVIKAGAAAYGEITQSVKKGSVGKPALIAVTVNHVIAVDGTIVALKGAKLVTGEDKQTSSLIFTLLCCILALLMQGTDAEIVAGSMISAEVYGNFSVEI